MSADRVRKPLRRGARARIRRREPRADESTANWWSTIPLSRCADRRGLLVLKILVGGQVHVEASGLRGGEERTVLQLSPASFESRLDHVVAERMPEWHGRSLVEQDSQTASRRNGETLARVLQHGIDLLARDAGKPREEFRHGGAPLEILEERAHRDARGAEYQLSAHLAGDALYGWALAPVEHAGSVFEDGDDGNGEAARLADTQSGAARIVVAAPAPCSNW